MNEEKPLLSICIPTYNRAKDLSRLLADIVGICKDQGIDVLVSDNGSTDDTLMVLERYRHHTNFRCLRNGTNLGYDLNILNLFKNASSQYVWLMGDDDLIDVNYLTEIIAIIRKHPDFGMMFIDYDIQDVNSNIFSPVTRPVSYTLVNQQNYCDQVLHRATLLSANIINMKYYSPEMINQACLGKKWLHVHIFLKIADKLAGTGTNNIIINEKIFKQRTGTVDENVYISWFIYYFLETVSLSKVTTINLDIFMNKFYSLAVRGALLEMGWTNSFAQSWQCFRRSKDKFGISFYDTIIFVFTTSLYRLIGPKRLKFLKKLFVLRQIMLFLRGKM